MLSIDRLTSAELSREFLSEIRGLLDLAFGNEFSDEDWQHTIGGWHVIATEGTRVVSHAAVVPRILYVAKRPFLCGYVEGVGTDPARQGDGIGSQVVGDASRLIEGEFEMGALSTERHHFYQRLGWERWRGPTYVRNGSDLFRTEDEDDVVMVLRFGPSADVDLGVAMSCETRGGDDW